MIRFSFNLSFPQRSVLLYIKLRPERDVDNGIARTAVAAISCVVIAIVVNASPIHARIPAIARVLRSPFPTITK